MLHNEFTTDRKTATTSPHHLDTSRCCLSCCTTWCPASPQQVDIAEHGLQLVVGAISVHSTNDAMRLCR